jgi:integrase
MTIDPRPETLAYIAHYNPAKGPFPTATPAQWVELRPVVLEGVRPLAYLAKNTLRPFIRALTRLALFAHQLGYEMDAKVLLDPALIDAFLGTIRQEAQDPAPYLWRLSDSWGLVAAGSTHRGVTRPDYRRPYDEDEMAALLLAAHNQSSGHRTATLLAIIFLGAGCGVTREAARDVTALDLHRHDGAWFVRTPKYCARVREEFLPLLDEVATLHPSGPLRGAMTHKFVTVAAAEWLRNRRGVPALSVDRLRANYVCTLLGEPVSIVDVLAWTGLRGAESLNGYLDHVARPSFKCATSSKGAK